MRLARGRHASPDQGACVMELASMLAGEPFSDRPQCADPVLAALLRALNDRLGHHRRQALRPYAAAVVGTAGNRRVTRARRARCLAYVGAGRLPRLRIAVLIGLRAALSANGGAGEWAAREAIIRGGNDGFDLLDALLAEGGVPSPRAGRTPLPAAAESGLEPAPLPAPVVDRPELGVPAL